MLLTVIKISSPSWAWMLVIYPWGLSMEKETNVSVRENDTRIENQKVIDNTIEKSVHDEALIKIDNLLNLIQTLQNQHGTQHYNFSQPKPMQTTKIVSTFLQLMTELCYLLHPFESRKQQGPIHLIYVPEFTPYEPVDHFGCKSLLSSLQHNITSMPQNAANFIIIIKPNLIQWRSKLLSPLTNNANGSNIAPILHKLSLTTSQYPQVTSKKHLHTSTLASVRFNKGMTRYDNSWIRPDINNKFPGREVIFHDTFDTAKNESSRMSTLHSILRILPAFVVIAFLIFCWYCFVYHRLQRRHRRTRTLLCQYQSLLNGHLGNDLARNLMVINNTETSPNGVLCSSSTYNSCLNSETDSVCRQEPTETPHNTPDDDRTRARSYPPTYDEIFPPPYEALYGNIV